MKTESVKELIEAAKGARAILNRLLFTRNYISRRLDAAINVVEIELNDAEVAK